MKVLQTITLSKDEVTQIIVASFAAKGIECESVSYGIGSCLMGHGTGEYSKTIFEGVTIAVKSDQEEGK